MSFQELSFSVKCRVFPLAGRLLVTDTTNYTSFIMETENWRDELDEGGDELCWDIF